MTPLRPKILGYEAQLNNKIVYVLEITNQKTNKSKLIKLRYSEFRNIHNEIVTIVDKLKIHVALPDFPSRNIFSSTNKSEELIFDRKNQLTDYLTNLLSIEKIRCLDIIQKYYVPEDVEQQNKGGHINMQICIDKQYKMIEDIVIYYITLRDLNTNNEWTFKSRYSQLSIVNNALLEAKIKNLPKFPSKKIFGITNQSPQDIQKRRQQLQKYFSQIFANRQIVQNEVIKFFIRQSKLQSQKNKQIQVLCKEKKVRHSF